MKSAAGVSVSLEGVSKRFGATQALQDITLEIVAGEIHALVGENGAGKSTLGKVVGGIYAADSGVLRIDGEEVPERWDPQMALHAGVTTIQQELSLVPALPVVKNVFLGIERSRFGVLRGNSYERYRELDNSVGFGIDPEIRVQNLRAADRQKVEILRALARNARLIVMDEPTSSLTQDEAERLHEIMDRLRSEGRTIIYVSHSLDEVLRWSDRITVLRDGRLIETKLASETTKKSLVEAMLDRPFDATFPVVPEVREDAPVVLELKQLSGDLPRNVSFTIRAGEIVGLAGLVGSGRSEIARLVFGADSLEAGTVLIHGEKLPRQNPSASIKAGVAMVPEDRRNLGLVLTMNLRENVTLARLSTLSRRGAVSIGAERSVARKAIEQLSIVPPRIDGDIQTLSGGNQQRVLFAKWALAAPDIIILDEPTRGIDVGAKQKIYEAIVDVAASGAAVLLISSELEEVMQLSHTVYLLSNGEVFDVVDPQEVSVDDVVRRLFGTHAEQGRES